VGLRQAGDAVNSDELRLLLSLLLLEKKGKKKVPSQKLEASWHANGRERLFFFFFDLQL
jgi:hypothetical protein